MAAHAIGCASVTAFTVGQLAIDNMRFAERYYRKNDQPTSQETRVRVALKPGWSPMQNTNKVSPNSLTNSGV